MGFPQLTKRGKTKLVLKEKRLKSNLEGPDQKGDRNGVSDAIEWMECRVRCTKHHKSQVMAKGLIKMVLKARRGWKEGESVGTRPKDWVPEWSAFGQFP